MKKQKTKSKTWEVMGYYFDGKQAWTHLKSLDNRMKIKRVRGLI